MRFSWHVFIFLICLMIASCAQVRPRSSGSSANTVRTEGVDVDGDGVADFPNMADGLNAQSVPIGKYFTNGFQVSWAPFVDPNTGEPLYGDYTVYRGFDNQTMWAFPTNIEVTDTNSTAVYLDETAVLGQSYYYRIEYTGADQPITSTVFGWKVAEGFDTTDPYNVVTATTNLAEVTLNWGDVTNFTVQNSSGDYVNYTLSGFNLYRFKGDKASAPHYWWHNDLRNVISYDIVRKFDNLTNDWTLIASSLPPETREYKDSTLSPGVHTYILAAMYVSSSGATIEAFAPPTTGFRAVTELELYHMVDAAVMSSQYYMHFWPTSDSALVYPSSPADEERFPQAGYLIYAWGRKGGFSVNNGLPSSAAGPDGVNVSPGTSFTDYRDGDIQLSGDLVVSAGEQRMTGTLNVEFVYNGIAIPEYSRQLEYQLYVATVSLSKLGQVFYSDPAGSGGISHWILKGGVESSYDAWTDSTQVTPASLTNNYNTLLNAYVLGTSRTGNYTAEVP